MTELDKQALAFAELRFRTWPNKPLTEDDTVKLMAEAYVAGWEACDLKNNPIIGGYVEFGEEQEEAEDYKYEFPIVGETEPYVYDPNWVPDWSVHIDLSRCTPTQLRILSELGYSLGNVKRKQAKNDCRYFSEGKCCLTEDSGDCVRDSCTAYSPKTGMEMAKEGDTNVPEHRNPFINNPLLDARYTIGGSELKKIDYSVKIPNIEDKTGKNE